MSDKDTATSRLSSGLHFADQKILNSNKFIQENRDQTRERASRQRDLSKIKMIKARAETNPFDPRYRKRVVVYCRVSTDGISQTTSFELQKKYYLKYVRKHPEWKLFAMYSDEGLTATTTKKRIGLLTTLEDARAGKIDIIVVKNLSRLSRNLQDCMNIVFELRSLPHPVGILFETENMFTLDKNIDFTLNVLALVAQEESHKKSEAIVSANRQRNDVGEFLKPDLLGFDKVGINEIAINAEEAKTVQLIFMMYLASISLKTIVEVLTMLGRKTHTHKYKDGRVKEGEVKWTVASVLNILRNERRCGKVYAPKTYTPNYLDHKARKVDDSINQYHAIDQHPAIVSPDDFDLVQRMIKANKGGWNSGLPNLYIYSSGSLCGYVSAVPAWRGFGADDYNRAALKAYGIEETELCQIANQNKHLNEFNEESKVSAEDFQYQYTIDSDDYDLFPDVSDEDEEPNDTEKDVENFKDRIRKVRKAKPEKIADPKEFGCFDLSNCAVVRAQMFSIHEKPCLTMDRKGISFNRRCFQKITVDGNHVEYVDLLYNPIDQIIVLKPTINMTERTLNWVKSEDYHFIMRRCPCRGIMSAVFENMDWNEDYRFRLVGAVVREGSLSMLAFSLNEPIIIVPVKPGSARNIDTENINNEKTRQIMRDGYLPEQCFIPNLDDFELSGGAMATAAKNMARSRAIYYDDMAEKANGELSVDVLGDQKFDPECIRRLIQKDLSPKEGWSYLRGMAVFTKSGFSIFPAHWAGNFGDNLYQSRLRQFIYHVNTYARRTVENIKFPYGWTLGLELPTEKTVQEAIEYLKSEMAG